MTRPYPVPAIEIYANAYEDDDSGRVTIHPVIRAYTQASSLGTLALNQFEDLHILRNAIDTFIETNGIPKLSPMKKDSSAPEERPVPQFASIIEGYLSASGFTPMNRDNFNPKGMAIRSSQEIILDLADMVDLSLNDVAESMLYLGYCTCVSEDKVGWLLGSVRSGE